MVEAFIQIIPSVRVTGHSPYGVDHVHGASNGSFLIRSYYKMRGSLKFPLKKMVFEGFLEGHFHYLRSNMGENSDNGSVDT